ncbi:MAG: PAS domain S-box protein [Magnetococcus sp. YQC-9]
MTQIKAQQDIQLFRQRLLDEILLGIAIAAVPGVVLSLVRMTVIGWRLVMAFHLVGLVVLWLLWLGRRRFSSPVKVSALLTLCWITTYAGFATLGPMAGTQVFAVLFAFTAILLVGGRTGWLLVVGNMVCLSLFSYIATSHGFTFDLDYQVVAYHPLTWSALAWNLSAYGTVLAWVAWRMVQGLWQRQMLNEELLEKQAVSMAALSSAEQRLSATLENAPNVAVQWYDRAGCVCYWNRASERMFGWTAEEATGKTSDALMRDAQGACDFAAMLADIAETGNVIGPIENVVRHRDGSSRAVSSTTFSIQTGNDQLFVCMDIDITGHKQAEEALRSSQHFFSEMIENWPEPMLLIDGSQFCEANPAAMQMLGYPSMADFLPCTPMDISPLLQPDGKPSAVKAPEMIAHALQGVVWRFDWLCLRHDGSEIYVDVTLAPIERNGRKLVLCAWHDITHLLRARQAAEQLAQAKNNFVASMSHELRTPLNAIIGFAQMLSLGVPVALQEEQKEPVEHILNGGRHLLGLINGVLDLARIDSGRIDLDMRPLAVKPIITQAIALIEPVARQRKVLVRHASGANVSNVFVHADAGRVQQVLLNLLSNAVKYNHDAGLVSVSCEPIGAHLRIAVTDCGYGIPAERQGELFQPFQRLGAERTAIEGAGIGLVITKHIVEAMGGAIGFRSKVGVGSRFWIDLPMCTQDESAVSSDRHHPLSAAASLFDPVSQLRGTVLYVEDNPANASLMHILFRQLPGVELRIAESAEACLALIRNELPDLVLMDINLPGMSGLEALRQIKSDPVTAILPVVAVTAAASSVDIQSGKEAGFHDYLTKPFDVPSLLALIRRMLP